MELNNDFVAGVWCSLAKRWVEPKAVEVGGGPEPLHSPVTASRATVDDNE